MELLLDDKDSSHHSLFVCGMLGIPDMTPIYPTILPGQHMGVLSTFPKAGES